MRWGRGRCSGTCTSRTRAGSRARRCGPEAWGWPQAAAARARVACALGRAGMLIVGWASPIGHRELAQLARGTRAGRLQFADGDSNVVLRYAPREAVLHPDVTGWQQRLHCTPPRVRPGPAVAAATAAALPPPSPRCHCRRCRHCRRCCCRRGGQGPALIPGHHPHSGRWLLSCGAEG